MKRTIAIVAGGDTSEYEVSLRSAQGIYSFIDKEKYTLYIVGMHGPCAAHKESTPSSTRRSIHYI